MEGFVPESKYKKLASEYSKLRAQASVLKKAVVEVQTKEQQLREQLRQRETALRRTEQEVDSLGFRNRQLESRVASLQEELAKSEGRTRRDKEQNKRAASHKGEETYVTGANQTGVNDVTQDAIIFEELQKKIMENAQLTSLIDDKERDLVLCNGRISCLEHKLQSNIVDQTELEKRLRKEVETLQSKNSELETKLVEAASMLGSEDALSASGSENTPLHILNHQQITAVSNSSLSSEERIALLEKEVSHWRSQYEVAKLHDAFVSSSCNESNSPLTIGEFYCSCSTTAAGITVKPGYQESRKESAQRARDSMQEPTQQPAKEQLLYNSFCRKYEDLLLLKCQAESRLRSFEIEVDHLQNCFENATHELKSKDEDLQIINQTLQQVEDDLATTRANYEEQISVLTEQIINLSEQLAASK